MFDFEAQDAKLVALSLYGVDPLPQGHPDLVILKWRAKNSRASRLGMSSTDNNAMKKGKPTYQFLRAPWEGSLFGWSLDTGRLERFHARVLLVSSSKIVMIRKDEKR